MLFPPALTSAPLASPVAIHWTPAVHSGDSEDHGEGHGHGNGKGHGKGDGHGDDAADGSGAREMVLRADGPCAPGVVGHVVASLADPAAGDFSDPVGDGTYCYAIAVADDASTAVGPGLTVVVSTRSLVPAGAAF